MVAVKMFWDMWKNLTSATTNWSFTGNGTKKGLATSKPTQRTRYNRLRSGPTKSYSQPANLISLATSSSSSESLASPAPEGGCGPPGDNAGAGATSGSSPKHGNSNQRSKEGKRWGRGSSSIANMKHSISSTFPFSTTLSSMMSSSSTTTPPNSQETTKAHDVVDQGENVSKESSSSLFANNATTGLFASANGSSSSSRSDAKKSYADSGRIGSNVMAPTTASPTQQNAHQQPTWDKARKQEETPQQQDFCEDDISDLDEDVEHLTCDVCDRAFPTLRKLAEHQRKKRHYGCLQCDSIFPSREILEYHREQMLHYDYAIDVYEEGGSDSDSFESDDDENGIGDTDDCDDEERERLL